MKRATVRYEPLDSYAMRWHRRMVHVGIVLAKHAVVRNGPRIEEAL